MKPVLNFHGIAKIDLGPIERFDGKEKRGHFWHRTITLRDDKGDRYSFSLFSEQEDGLWLECDLRDAASGRREIHR